MKTIPLQICLLGLALLFTLPACSGEEDLVVIPAPASEDAAFTYAYDSENPNKVLFQAATTVNTWYTHWDFGDFTSAEGMEATKTYFLKGSYDVRFKIFTEGGTAETVQRVEIEADFMGPNLIRNGELDSDEFWTLLPIADGVEVTFENGAAYWSGGGWGHAGIYQAIEVEAGVAYQINMDVSGGGLSDCWFEVYAGREEPVPYVDYTDGGIRLGINTWEGCGSDPFAGPLTAVACTGEGGTFEFPTSGTVSLVIRGGGVDYGTAGITIDNISVRPL